VSTQASSLGGGSSSILQMNAGPSSSSPAGVKPAEIMALYPVDNGAAHPRSMFPPHGAKSTTTISPVVVLQLLRGSAATGSVCQTPATPNKEAIRMTIATALSGRRSWRRRDPTSLSVRRSVVTFPRGS
jgi:hypothetical protein